MCDCVPRCEWYSRPSCSYHTNAADGTTSLRRRTDKRDCAEHVQGPAARETRFKSKRFGLLGRCSQSHCAHRFFKASLDLCDLRDQLRASIAGRRNFLDRLLAVMKSEQLVVQGDEPFSQGKRRFEVQPVGSGCVSADNHWRAADLSQERRGGISTFDPISGCLEKLKPFHVVDRLAVVGSSREKLDCRLADRLATEPAVHGLGRFWHKLWAGRRARGFLVLATKLVEELKALADRRSSSLQILGSLVECGCLLHGALQVSRKSHALGCRRLHESAGGLGGLWSCHGSILARKPRRRLHSDACAPAFSVETPDNGAQLGLQNDPPRPKLGSVLWASQELRALCGESWLRITAVAVDTSTRVSRFGPIRPCLCRPAPLLACPFHGRQETEA